jgi:hypothetical protein
VESAPLKDRVVCGRWIARGLVGSTRRSLARELARGFVASELGGFGNGSQVRKGSACSVGLYTGHVEETGLHVLGNSLFSIVEQTSWALHVRGTSSLRIICGLD